MEFKAKEKIAFLDKDPEGDVWCERAFFFDTWEQVNAFFVPDNPILLDIYAQEGKRVLRNFNVYNNNPAKKISTVTFETKYAGEVKIINMASGYVISKDKTKN